MRLRGWLGVLVVIVLVDIAVRMVFVPQWLIRTGNIPGDGLRDGTYGRNLGVVFALAERTLATASRSLAVVGDSTVMGKLGAPGGRLTPLIERAFNAHPGEPRPITAIELGFLGLTTPDAAVIVAKALAMNVDLVVFAVTPRIVCRMAAQATDARRHAMEWGIASRLGIRFLVDEFSLATMAESVVRSHWALLRFQHEIRTELALAAASHLPRSWSKHLIPARYEVNLGSEAAPLAGPLWGNERCPLDDDSPEVVALRHLLDACAAERRCFIYHGPINPDGMGSFEPGLLARFRALITRMTKERNVPFHDYTDDLPASGFRKPFAGRPDAIHIAESGRLWLASELAKETRAFFERR
jgi:hypothetical protein